MNNITVEVIFRANTIYMYKNLIITFTVVITSGENTLNTFT